MVFKGRLKKQNSDGLLVFIDYVRYFLLKKS